ncbi:hypothetical protein EDB81DRAFT_848005 [Dactylonectria macrodidyma]|uniref:Rhodopsin domain-containing protein n=1 Tax=Dactylonectria macrodidyma TaxID=307937 RepID=A0A9P9IEV5_9HYPO|nr:hypothetical protein EDB81DRAFT_848005 [Dactylonectria macrodidyma]
MAVAETICFYFAMRSAYVGVHMVDIPRYVDFAVAQRWNYIATIIYNPILALVKTSLLLFLLRLGGHKRKVRVAIVSLLVFNLCQMVALFICCVFQCTPINYLWMAVAPGGASRKGKCIDQNAFLISTASLTIVTDVLVLILPFWIFVGLKLPLRVRVAIIGVFALGGVVTLLGILRLAWMVEKAKALSSDPQKTDYTYDIRFTYAVIETNLAIITASAPALRPMFLMWFPNFFSALRSSKNNYSPSRGRDERSMATNRTRGGTGVRSSLRGPFPLKEIKRRAAIRTHSPTKSEEEIMTYDGIVRTSDVTVEFDDVEAVPQAHLGLGPHVERGRDGQWRDL